MNPKPKIKTKPLKTKIIGPNLLIPENMDAFLMDVYKNNRQQENVITVPEYTSVAFIGCLTNVVFIEEKLRNQMHEQCILVEHPHIHRLKCNYWDISSSLYTEVIKVRKSNRGRKKITEKKKSIRKKQGDGSSFNSQITFYLATRIPSKYYKIKVFRDGRVQNPGLINPAHVFDLIECYRDISQVFSKVLQKNVVLSSLNPIMKNYKCKINIRDKTIINLNNLKTSLINYPPKDIEIKDIKYDCYDIKLTVKFTWNNLPKYVSVKIFMSGKINILNGLENILTKQIYSYLCEIIKIHCDSIIVTPGQEVMGGQHQRQHQHQHPIVKLIKVENKEIEVIDPFADPFLLII